MDEKQRYDEGMQVRRAVLGDAHVDRSLNALTEFNSEFQEMITRHAWGDIWTRPGLARHTRSLITIAMLIGMNRNEELKLHLRAAANNGVTRAEAQVALANLQALDATLLAQMPEGGAIARQIRASRAACVAGTTMP